MKTSDWFLIGGAGLVAYFLFFQKKQEQQQEPASWGITNDLGGLFGSGFGSGWGITSDLGNMMPDLSWLGGLFGASSQYNNPTLADYSAAAQRGMLPVTAAQLTTRWTSATSSYTPTAQSIIDRLAANRSIISAPQLGGTSIGLYTSIEEYMRATKNTPAPQTMPTATITQNNYVPPYPNSPNWIAPSNSWGGTPRGSAAPTAGNNLAPNTTYAVGSGAVQTDAYGNIVRNTNAIINETDRVAATRRLLGG